MTVTPSIPARMVDHSCFLDTAELPSRETARLRGASQINTKNKYFSFLCVEESEYDERCTVFVVIIARPKYDNSSSKKLYVCQVSAFT